MKRLLYVRILPTMGAAMLCGCMATPDPGSNGNGNSNGNTNTNNNSSGGSKFTLSVSVVNAEGPSEGPRVQIFAGDRAIDRLEMTTVARLFELAGSEERGLTQRDLQIDAGMVVTLIALESRGVSTSRLTNTNTDLSDFRSIDNAEFVNFVPDSMAGITFSENEQSVMSFTMDRDISVVANFRQMPSIRLALEGDEVITFGLLDVDLEAPKWLSEPTQLSDGSFICDAGNVGADPPDTGTSPPLLSDDFVYLAQVKSGTMFTFTAVDLDGSGYTFSRWSANTNNCGGGRTCLLTLGSADHELTGTWVRP